VAVVACSVGGLFLGRRIWPESDPAALLVAPAVVFGAVATLVRLLANRASQAPEAALTTLRRVGEQDRTRFLEASTRFTHRRDRLTQAADVGFGPLGHGVLPREAEAILLHWQQVGQEVEGTLATVGDYFRGLEDQRLVIVGAPGSGKTVLASRLLLDLLANPSGTTERPQQVPVWVPLTSYYPDAGLRRRDDTAVAKHFGSWLSRQVGKNTRIRPKVVARLMEERRILPILDGLDEMPAKDSMEVIRALNQDKRVTFVVTSRTADYVDSLDGDEGQVIGGRHIELSPLTAAEIAHYITSRYPTVDGVDARWRPVLDAVKDPEHWIGGFLATPWHLFLMTANFDDGDAAPASLLDEPADQAMRILLEGLVPAVVRGDRTARARGWTGPQINAWLSVLARQVNSSGGSRTSFSPLETWRLAGRWPEWVVPGLTLAVGLVAALLTLVVPGLPWTRPLVLLTAAALLTVPTGSSPVVSGGQYLRNLMISSRVLTIWILLGLVFGLVYGAVLASAFGPMAMLVGGLVLGLFGALEAGLVIALVFGQWGRLETVLPLRPSELMRRGTRFSLFFTAFVVSTCWLAFGMTFGLDLGLVAGLLVGRGNTWVRYLVGIAWASRQNRCPWRFAVFLDWCLDQGLMRQTGILIEFRHRELLDWCAQRSTPPVDAPAATS